MLRASERGPIKIFSYLVVLDHHRTFDETPALKPYFLIGRQQIVGNGADYLTADSKQQRKH